MVKIDNENEATARIESALYSAGRPLSVEDLIRASGTESRKTTINLQSTTFSGNSIIDGKTPTKITYVRGISF